MRTQVSSKSTPMILVTVTLLLCAVIISAAAGVAPSSVIAQEEEDTSLGEEDLAGGIVSNVLGGSEDDEQNGDADGENDQDTTVTATVDRNQENQNDLTDFNEFGDQDALNVGVQEQDQRAANLALNEALDVTVEPTPPPPDDGLPPECALEITADKEIYEPEDVVAITITNTGDEPLEFPDSALGLQIKNVDTGEVFPLAAAQVITTLEPGESKTFEFTYEDLVREIGTGLISATVMSECGGAEEVTFRLSAAPPPEEIVEKIVFSSTRDGNFEIYIMNAEGSDQHNISNNPDDSDQQPNWSPAADTD